MKTKEEFQKFILDIGHKYGLGVLHQDELIMAMKKVYIDAQTEAFNKAVSTVEYWKSGHESRLRSFPTNETIKCEIRDCEEIKQAILNLISK